MRTITFKGLFLTVLFVLLGSLAIQAADDGLITEQITIKLDKAGTLPDRISESQKYLITNLKIVGKVNGTDWKLIRNMAGSDFYGRETGGKLSILDLSDARIVKGGSAYYSDYEISQCTSNDKLGDYAFYGCSRLTNLILPSSVTEIGGAAFRGCSGLTNLTIPSSITSIAESTFRGCSGLTSLTIPSSVTEIGYSAFSGCSGLTSLVIPSSVTSLGASCFSGCSGLTNLVIPSSVTSIGESALRGCSGLTSLTIPSSVTEIGSHAFSGCSGLTSLTIPSSVTSIGYGAFSGCSGLTSLTIPSSVTEIGGYAFRDCSRLTSLVIPSSVTSIGDAAFYGCNGLTSIYAYPENLPKLGTEVFTGCDAKNCMVYVPTGTYADYKSSEFGYFENIKEFDPTGIDKDGLITKQITIKLDKAGTLPNMISESKKYLITNLKIVGEMNGTDLKFIREMAGCDYNKNKTDGKLSILDLYDAKIVEGGAAYISYYGKDKYTSNDELGDYAFSDCSGLTSLTIPSCVTRIGDYAFIGCSGLTSLTIPSSVTSIGESAFEGCSGLTSMIIPSSVTEIGNYAFRGCSGLTSLTIPSSVTSIGREAFSGCSGLTSLTIPSRVTSIGYGAFSGCSGVTSLVIPSSVTSIDIEAFAGCSGLTSIYVYLVKLPEMRYDIFKGCDAKNCIVYVPKGTYMIYRLSNFNYFENIVESDANGIDTNGLITGQITIKLNKAGTLPNMISESQKYLITNLKIVGKMNGTDLKFIREMAGRGYNYDYNEETTDGKLSILDLYDAKIVEGGAAYISYHGKDKYTSNDELGDFAFYECSGLTSVTIPSSVTAIGKDAFFRCSGLTNLTIPSGVTAIGKDAFFRCSGLTSLTIPSSVTSIGEFAFSGCSGLTSLTIPSSVTSIGDAAFYGCSGLTSLTIPSSVTEIGRSAFYGCSGLTSLTIPSSVTEIGIGAFSDCSGLTSLTIPSSVTSIGDAAFEGCSGLTSLTIPSSVTSIGDAAFSGCSGLTSLVIPSSVTSIGESAFKGCSGLTSLSIPSSVTSIGKSALKGCSGLTSIYVYPEKLPELGTEVFTGCNAQNCTVYVPKGTYDDYKASEFGYFENIVEGIKDGLITTQITIKLDEAGTLPDSISESQKNLIPNLKIVGEVNGTDLKFIREMAGRDYYINKTDGKLSILDLSDAKIVEGGFPYVWYYDCMFTSNDKLGDKVFEGCSGLTSLTLPSGVTEIGKYAFKGCSGLTNLTIPACVTEIGESAFEGCSGLTSLTVPSSVTNIGYYAFKDCSRLTSLTIPSSVTWIGGSAFENCSGLTSIYVYPENLPELESGIFSGCNAQNCTVYVPKGTYDAYKSSEFGYFEKIVEFDATGIDKVTTSTDVKEVSRYSVNGQRLSAPAKGLNVVKYSDGSVEKVAVQ